MPEPKKKKKRSYEAQPGSALDGLRLVQQRAARPSQAETENHNSGEDQRPSLVTAPEPELVEKLIHFIKSI
jgi:hypothetical protein